MSTLFSLQYSYKYIFTTVPISDIQSDLYDVLVNFLHATFATVFSLLCILYYLLIVAAKILILAFPHAVRLGKIIYKFHRTQLSTKDIIIEVVSLVILFSGFLLRKRIHGKWKQFEAYVSKKSKAAAKAAPHVLFFLGSFLFSLIGRKFLQPLTSASTMPLFTTVIPLITTTRVATLAQSSSFGSPKDARGHALLMWIILAIYHSLVTVCAVLPFSDRLMARMPFLKEVVIVVLVWAQLSSVFAKIVFETIISRVLLRVGSMIPAGYSEENNAAKTSTLLSVLKVMRVLSDSNILFLKALFQDSVATVLALLFLFMPTPIAMVGAVTIALLLPAFRTASAASISLQHAELSAASGGRERITDGEKENMHARNQHWLYYWICLGCVWLLRIYVMRLWPSVIIVVTLWLQHSYFQGARRCLHHFYETLGVLIARNRKTQMEKHMPELTVAAGGGSGGGEATDRPEEETAVLRATSTPASNSSSSSVQISGNDNIRYRGAAGVNAGSENDNGSTGSSSRQPRRYGGELGSLNNSSDDPYPPINNPTAESATGVGSESGPDRLTGQSAALDQTAGINSNIGDIDSPAIDVGIDRDG